ncbi:hypothetical protein LC065_18470 [Halobacillus litoralis]|uniref:hypothetical protein n=1 Tax=Halobacillus litoralis TaxID=45668 RepID=UPI001CFE4EB4|nr:hypothetical protein [Halobacillus litoralis]WLR47472.1 hypothetical protein LC065_18470 [Halobacillus litoralis]
MKRHSALIIVILLLSFSLPFTYGEHHSGYFKGDVQESTLLETAPSNDVQTDKAFVIPAFFVYLLIVHLCTKVTSTSRRAFRKFLFLNPVFYQSNYVI